MTLPVVSQPVWELLVHVLDGGVQQVLRNRDAYSLHNIIGLGQHIMKWML